MTLPLSTTSIDVLDPEDGDDTVAPGAGSVVESDVRAHFSTPKGSDQGAERVDKVLNADPIPDLSHRHIVVDRTTFDRWQVVWVDQRVALGLDHTVAGVNRIRGAA